MDHGAEVGHKMPPSPYRQGISCHYSPNDTDGEPVLPLTKDSPDRFLLESVLKVGVERGKNERRNAVKLLASPTNSREPGA